ncbi:GNAT family N-acetyltransferase [Streptomyces albus subsp. chlorinus]|uniref:GNAT family N-acetyltransferase n=1 Tax=Streptomyces albus TaxID=1888 RepID=UPI00156E1F19|nr:GNAT family N-acetyltransferase [Streptomyces albus]NSC20299.1 GNAT family N-acetyltransferase [Streptomyces albus subsp. chlorinus]
MRIRAGSPHELGRLQEIERAAGHWFRDLGMDEIADDEPPTLETLAGFARAGGLWVAVPETGGAPVAYALAEPVDGCLHLEQVSVHPDSARRGIGRALIGELAARAAGDGLPALTLTTFRDVPWNAPYYRRLGFRTLTDRELTPGLRRIRAGEAAAGLDRWPRVCMRRDLGGPGRGASGTAEQPGGAGVLPAR